MGIVKQYPRGRLTFQKDKLVALSGVARRIGSRTGDQYLAGLWRTDLELQLLWAVDPDFSPIGSNIRELAGLGFPSWSWASTTEASCTMRTRISRGSKKRPGQFDHNTQFPGGEPTGFGRLGQVTDDALFLTCGPLLYAGAVALSILSPNSHHPVQPDPNTSLTTPTGIVSRGKVIYDSDAPNEMSNVYFLPDCTMPLQFPCSAMTT